VGALQMGALQTGKFDAPECAGKQAYYVFAYDDSVSTLGPGARTRNHRLASKATSHRGAWSAHGSGRCDPRSVAVHERKSQLTLFLGREGKLNKNSTAEGALGVARAAARGGGDPVSPH
jgi:hypothetical protein